MKNFKRLFVLVLAVVMCLTAFAISSSAADEFNPTVNLLARYNETGDKIIVTVTTSDACGAIMGTLTTNATVNGALEIKLADSKFVEDVKTEDNSNYYTQVTNGVKFAVVTDKVTDGSKTWVDVYFDVKDIADGMADANALKFTFADVQVCSVGEELVDGAALNDDVSVEIPFVSLRALGAKKQADDNVILFGARVDLTGSTTNFKDSATIKVGDKEYQAKSCGYAYGYTNRVEGANKDFADFAVKLNAEGEVEPVSSDVSQYVLVKQCKKYKYWDAENKKFFVYTLKISNISDAAREISVRPYVVYADNEGNSFLIQGNVISRSCNGIAEAPAFLGVQGTNLW